MKVCHVAAYHPRLDNRIFFRECLALRDAGYEVYVLAPGGELEREVIQGVTMIRGPLATRKSDAWRVSNAAFEIARDRIQADVYHIHDIWLLPFGFKVKKRLGAKVIFDAHEDYVLKGSSRDWVPRALRGLLPKAIEWYEKRAARAFDGFVCVAESSRLRAESVGCKTIIIENFPPAAHFPQSLATFEEYAARGHLLVHTGVFNPPRGSDLMLGAARLLRDRGVDFQMRLSAQFPGQGPEARARVEDYLREHRLQEQVKLAEMVRYDRLGELLQDAAVGLSVQEPAGGYAVGHPTKIFEYMAYSIPTVGYNLPGHAELVEGNAAGWLFPEFAAESLADCLAEILPDVQGRYQRGVNGFRAFHEKYSWEKEAARLVGFYKSLGC